MPRRRSSFASTMARAQREAEAAHRRQLRQVTAAEKAARQQYASERAALVDQINDALSEQPDDLRSLLDYVLTIPDPLTFDALRLCKEPEAFVAPVHLTNETPMPKAPGLFGKLMPGTARRHEEDLRAREAAEAHRREALERAQCDHDLAEEQAVTRAQLHNVEIGQVEVAYHRCEPDAVTRFNAALLERSEYPDGFPDDFRLGYLPDSKELVIDYELPAVDVIPAVSQYVYVKSRDALEEKPRKTTEVKELYQDIVASIALRTLYEVFESNTDDVVQVVVFSGFVQTVDPSTGKDIRPYLISLRTTRAAFTDLDLRRVEKLACLRNLGAQVSPRPTEMQPVKPMIDFNMVDKRFVEQEDLLGNLDARPNLMELNPFEFENLVSNLFSKMGLDTKQTRSARDGSVDAVAFDTRPVLGGKVIIQAKRYRHTVGVSAVRDLYGTMMNEGANKGILVTTSGYGPDAYEFAKGKPIELMDGNHLLYHLNQVGIEARIVFPSEG